MKHLFCVCSVGIAIKKYIERNIITQYRYSAVLLSIDCTETQSSTITETLIATSPKGSDCFSLKP